MTANSLKIESLAKCQTNFLKTLIGTRRIFSGSQGATKDPNFSGLRLDCRHGDQYRDLDVKIEQWPSLKSDEVFDIKKWLLISRVSLGKTVVKCQISAAIGEPAYNRSTKGICRINCEYSPDLYRFHKAPNDMLVSLSRLLEKTYVKSNALNLDSLCIVKSELAWNLTCSILIEQIDGNIIDCSCLALLAALETFTLPEVEIELSNVEIIDPRKSLPNDLAIMHKPLCITCGLFEKENSPIESFDVLFDPNWYEESLANGCYTLAINNLREICACHMLGTISLTHDSSQQFTKKAFEVYKVLQHKLLSQIENLKREHAKQTDKKAGINYKCQNNTNDSIDNLEISVDATNENEGLDEIEVLIKQNKHFSNAKMIIDASKISPWSIIAEESKSTKKGESTAQIQPVPDFSEGEEGEYSDEY